MVQIEAVLKKYGYTLNTPWNEIDKNIQRVFDKLVQVRKDLIIHM